MRECPEGSRPRLVAGNAKEWLRCPGLETLGQLIAGEHALGGQPVQVRMGDGPGSVRLRERS